MVRIKLFYQDLQKKNKITYEIHVLNKLNHVEAVEVDVNKSDLEHLAAIKETLEKLYVKVEDSLKKKDDGK